MGWIKKNEKQYWQETRTIGHRINAAGFEVQVRKYFTAPTKKECLAKVDEFMLQQKLNTTNSKKAFGVLADMWIEEFYKNGPNADSTKAMYIRNWNKHIRPMEFYTWPVSSIEGTIIQRAYNTLYESGVPSSTIEKCHKLMRQFIQYLTLQNLCIDFSGSLRVPKDKNTQKESHVTVWSDDEIKTILGNFEKADPRFRLRFLVVLAYYTGCRIGELLALNKDDITPNGELVINKQLGETVSYDANGNVITGYGIKPPKSTRSIRTIPLNGIVLEEYRRHLEWQKNDMRQNGYITNYLFTTQNGTLYYQRNIRRALKRYYDTIGVEEKSVHTYRHTFGTNLCRNDIPIQVASSLLGHESIETTARYYVNVGFDEKAKAVETLSKMAVG
ncbi:MAG: site-specific integrase [Clostridia bacterium]|nr:site-specific integrase [Clostridia bacterium]